MAHHLNDLRSFWVMGNLLENTLDLKTNLKAGITYVKSEFNSLNNSPFQIVLFKFFDVLWSGTFVTFNKNE